MIKFSVYSNILQIATDWYKGLVMGVPFRPYFLAASKDPAQQLTFVVRQPVCMTDWLYMCVCCSFFIAIVFFDPNDIHVIDIYAQECSIEPRPKPIQVWGPNNQTHHFCESQLLSTKVLN